MLRTSPSRWRRWAARLAMASALALALGYLPYRLLDGSGLTRARKLETELRRTRRAIDQLRRENLRLRRDIHALRNDPAAIEEIARHELGMITEGEIVVKLEPQGSGTPPPARPIEREAGR